MSYMMIYKLISFYNADKRQTDQGLHNWRYTHYVQGYESAFGS